MRGGRSEKLAETLHPEQLEKTQNLNLTPHPTQCSHCRETPAETWGHCWSRGVRAAELGAARSLTAGISKGTGRVWWESRCLPPAVRSLGKGTALGGQADQLLRKILCVSLDCLHWFGTRTRTALSQNPTNKKHQKELGHVMLSHWPSE